MHFLSDKFFERIIEGHTLHLGGSLGDVTLTKKEYTRKRKDDYAIDWVETLKAGNAVYVKKQYPDLMLHYIHIKPADYGNATNWYINKFRFTEKYQKLYMKMQKEGTLDYSRLTPYSALPNRLSSSRRSLGVWEKEMIEDGGDIMHVAPQISVQLYLTLTRLTKDRFIEKDITKQGQFHFMFLFKCRNMSGSYLHWAKADHEWKGEMPEIINTQNIYQLFKDKNFKVQYVRKIFGEYPIARIVYLICRAIKFVDKEAYLDYKKTAQWAYNELQKVGETKIPYEYVEYISKRFFLPNQFKRGFLYRNE